MSIGIIDVGLGNIGSLQGALYSQGWNTILVRESSKLKDISHLILPGVGSFSEATLKLRNADLIKAIQDYSSTGRPILGICLGMQLLADTGTEGGISEGLSLIPGVIRKLNASSGFHLPLPHVGWNNLEKIQNHPLNKSIRLNIDFYFIHSFYFNVKNTESIIGTTQYGTIFPAFVGKENIVGIQFHPEKSQRNGLQLLDNFCMWDGSC